MANMDAAVKDLVTGDQMFNLQSAINQLQDVDFDTLQQEINAVQALAPAVDVNICKSKCVGSG